MYSFLNNTITKKKNHKKTYSEWESVAYKQHKHNLSHKVILGY